MDDESPHEWSTTHITTRVNHAKQRDYAGTHRRNPNRQAFLRRQSQSQAVNVLRMATLGKSSTAAKNILDQSAILHLTTPEADSKSLSISGPELRVNPLTKSAAKRFIGREKSFTIMLDLARSNGFLDSQIHSVWRSLPNLVIETDSKDDVLGEVLTGKTDYYHDQSASRILCIEPQRVPCTGGTLVTVIGQNLGSCREDITHFFVCGSSCIGSLDYLSRTKLQFTTVPFLAGKGKITLISQSVGKSECLASFEFFDPANLHEIKKTVTDLEGHDGLTLFEQLQQLEAALHDEVTSLVRNVVRK